MISNKRFNMLEISFKTKIYIFLLFSFFLFLFRFLSSLSPWLRNIFIRNGFIYERNRYLMIDSCLRSRHRHRDWIFHDSRSTTVTLSPPPVNYGFVWPASFARAKLPVDSWSSRLWDLIARVNSAHAVFSQSDWRIANYGLDSRLQNFSGQNINDIITRENLRG